jgi:hypothetical protein
LYHPVSGTVVVFKRNAETGLLKKVGRKLKLNGVSTVQIRNINSNKIKKAEINSLPFLFYCLMHNNNN